MLSVVNARECSGGLDTAVSYIHGIRGSERNYLLCKGAICNSSLLGKALPECFLLLKDYEIIGCSASQ